jgi:hypothetical protein
MPAVTTPISTPSGQSLPEVQEFAARCQVADLLDPLRQAIDRLFPMAHSVRLRLEEDPEIRDDCHLVFEVRASRADVPDFGAAKRRWHDELFRLCPAPRACLFRLTLIRVAECASNSGIDFPRPQGSH